MISLRIMMALRADDGMRLLIIGTQCHHESRSDEIMRAAQSSANEQWKEEKHEQTHHR